MPYMYILGCADGTTYVGSTIDLERRLAEHDAGVAAQYTRHRRPIRLLYVEEFARIDDAFAREKQVQGWSRAKRAALIDGRVAELPALAQKRVARVEVFTGRDRGEGE
ncbi:GIY-YIG nuclease family protein [Agromyces sp. MMS24-JH15]|uniref:GIY-YIG nuclease family protein n=1 Tax=Agromyces sp. MMS24-JH15 TaxID=3243765 RepID=UPI0037485C79